MAEKGRKTVSALSALRRFAREETEKKAAAEAVPKERCDLCGAFIPPDPDHRHLMEVATREISCVCRPCSVLFDSAAASEGRYLLVPDRILNLRDFEMSDAGWASLGVPVDMAFFFYSTPAGKVVAYYPSPMGPTESLLELQTWEELEESNPVLRDMERDVEALLVNRARGASEHFLVPMDECYKLVGLIRTRWRGFSGGREVWDDITGFFEGLGRRAKTVRVGQSHEKGAERMSDIRVGKPDTTQTSPSHVKGVKGGNDPGGYEKMLGHLPDGKATAARSTGVNSDKRNPIDPNSPNLSPA